MRGIGRRRFIGGAAAAACVGCAGDDTARVDGNDSGVDAPSTTGSSTPSTTGGRSGLPGLTSVHVAGTVDEVRAATTDGPLYVPAARSYVVSLDADAAETLADAADERLRPGLELGFVAWYQKCPHLGCRVPYCESSKWFECACHGAMFTATGEHRTGPSPRGLDAFAIVVDESTVAIDTGEVIRGLPPGTVVVDRDADGPHCVTPAGDA